VHVSAPPARATRGPSHRARSASYMTRMAGRLSLSPPLSISQSCLHHGHPTAHRSRAPGRHSSRSENLHVRTHILQLRLHVFISLCSVPYGGGHVDDAPAFNAMVGNCSTNSTIVFREDVDYQMLSVSYFCMLYFSP
jgi:hypothetical protein